jgi:hypothetical protein
VAVVTDEELKALAADVPNADKDDIAWIELRRGFDRIIALLDAAAGGRELTETRNCTPSCRSSITPTRGCRLSVLKLQVPLVIVPPTPRTRIVS